MTKQELAKLAVRAIEKSWDFDALKYGDDLYGKEHLANDVWDLVEECREIGMSAFEARYAI